MILCDAKELNTDAVSAKIVAGADIEPILKEKVEDTECESGSNSRSILASSSQLSRSDSDSEETDDDADRITPVIRITEANHKR